MKPLQIGDVVGEYRVTGIVGSGGMGAVYKIEHTLTKRVEAMKLLPPGAGNDPDQMLRFEREIQVQARLHHPNIVALYNAVRDGERIGLVMEFVDGESLRRKLEGGPLPVPTAVDYASQVLLALEYAHAAGVIHRDVAPANIIVTHDGVAKLTDFGLARGAKDLRLSSSGAPLGSPWYMSPEQVKGTGVVDPRADVYAMGAVFYEMLTGEKLFTADGAFAVMRAQVEAEPPRPSSRNPKVPAALDDVVMKALAKDPAERYSSAAEFRLAMQYVIAGVSLLGLPGSTPQPRSIPLPPPAPGFGFRPSPAAVLMVSVPVALAAGLFAVRVLPALQNPRTAISKPQAAAPIQPAAEAQPAALAPAGPEDTFVGPPAPADLPGTAYSARSRASRLGRNTGKSEQDYALRITGAEQAPPPPARVATRPQEPPRVAEASEPPAQKVDCALPPMTPHPALSEDSTSDKSQSRGNPLSRALGKVIPFHKVPKYDAGDTAQAPAK